MTNLSDQAQGWSDVASAWDAYAEELDAYTAGATERLISRAAILPGNRVLELACGPGSLGGVWSRLAGPTGSVLLSDVAPDMVSVAMRRNAGYGNVTVTALDLSTIDLPDGSADVVVCRMGLMFAPVPSVAFGEIRRVLAPGGRLAALTWAGMAENPWLTCVGMAAMSHGLVSGGPPVAPGDIFSLGDPAVLSSVAAGAGFADVSVEGVDVRFRSASIDEHVTRVIALAGPLAAAFAGIDQETLAAVRRTAAELASGYTVADGVAIPGRALLISGRVA
jgi:SAM-dependent methyltransferase